MASRAEEKARRRAEREAREAAERAAAARRKRMQLAFGGVLGIALVAGIVVLVISVGGKSSGGGEGQPVDPSKAAAVTLPQQQTGDVNAAAKAAGCVLQHPPIEGRNHENKQFTEADYKTNPPTSGNHFPQWYQDGIYNPGDTPNLGMLVHPLEHGRIEVQYKPGTPTGTVDGLQALLKEQDDGYHMLLFQNTTKMPYAVAATSWGQLLGCKTFSPKVYDALRTFHARYIDKGPEQVP